MRSLAAARVEIGLAGVRGGATRRQLIVGVACALLADAPARAQEQRGAIEGVVRDAQGLAVPGVAVLARHEAGTAIEVVTQHSGTYRFAALPPGWYEITALLAGFAPARVVNIDLALGVQLTIDLILKPAGVDEAVEVVTPSPLVAVTQSARATNLRDEDVEKMPRGRDVTSLAVQVAGANDEQKLGGISIDGSSGAENRMVIDGVETTNTWVGTPGQFLVTDLVEELQVKSSGYSAEYGGSTGGVLNVITKSGSNAWHGEALVYWSGDALDAAPRPVLRLVPDDPARAEYVTYPEDDYDQVEPGFTLGGPILRDRLWIFAGYVPSFRPLDRTVTFRADGTTGTFRQDLRRHHAAANLSAQLDSRWRVKAAFSTGWQSQTGLLPALDGTGNPDADYSIDEINPNYSASASLDYTPSHWAFLSGRAGYFFRNIYDEGVYRGDQYEYVTSSVGFPGVPPEYQQPRGYANVPTNTSRDRGEGPRLAAQIDGTVYFPAAGQHQLKAGVQFDRIGLDALAGGTGNQIFVFWDQSFPGGSRGPFGYYGLFSSDRLPNRSFVTVGDAAVNNVGIFLQDAWTIAGRLTIHAGLRTENEHVPSLSPDPRVPNTAIHYGFADKLAPRLGFAWDARGDGKTKVYGSWGVFYDITKLELSFGFGGFSSVAYAFTLDSGDIGAIVDDADCPPACPGRLISTGGGTTLLNDPDDNQIDPGLRQTRLQEAVLGLEREIAPNLSVEARYVHKQIDRAVEDTGTLDAQGNGGFTIGNPGFGRVASFYPFGGTSPLPLPKAKRDYDAVEIGLDRRLSGGWAARASYTWSRLHGNYSGLAHSDEDGRVAPNVGGTFDYPLMSFDETGTPVYGVLATDRTHQVKTHLLVDFPTGTSVGVRWLGASGIPRTRQATFSLPQHDGRFIQVPVMYRGRNSDGRLPFASQLDLYVQHQVRLGERLRLTLSANAINLLNQSAATNYYPNELFQRQAIVVDETEFFYQGIDTQALIAEQEPVRDARFLMDSGYQAPRTVRLGIKLAF